MKFIYLFLVVMLGFGPLFGQNTGTIRGTVKTSDGSPAEFVNVGIQGTAKGTVAGRNGHFEISKVSAGSHIVTASFVGLESQQHTVEVKAGEVTTLDFTLNENAEKLQEVVVSSGRLVGESFYVSRMPLKNIENMQVYNTVSSGCIEATGYYLCTKMPSAMCRVFSNCGNLPAAAVAMALRCLLCVASRHRQP